MRFILSLCALLMLSVQPALAAGKEGIAVIVNQDVITKSDVNERLNLIAASTGMPKNPELMAKLRPQIVDMLVDEQIRMQEARRLKIDITKEDVEGGFKQIAQQNNIDVSEFKKMLKARGINLRTMEDQIKAQMAWGKVIQKKLRPQIEVSEADIDSELEILRGKIGKTEYLVSNIYLPVTEQKKEAEVSSLANRVVGQLRQQPELFPRVAQQLSQAPGAANGGNLGWVSEGQLPEDLEKVLPKLALKEISAPIKTTLGYYIMVVREKREITEATLPKRDDIAQRLGMERIERAQRRYMMDLQGSAYIEVRS